jgi:TPP-dependent pyruvate/acetoin dehydrogenase alpha subunit
MTDSLTETFFYRSLYRIRRMEEEIGRIYPTDVIQSPVHLSIGQEAISVGVCSALESSDRVFGTYRSHAFYLAKGGDLKAMLAELYGKAAGCAHGKGGSMHLVDGAASVMGTSAVVGSGIPQAVGAADQAKYEGRGTVVACFFGDGAVDEGVTQESMNLAVLWKVPLLFVCENNRYAIHTHQRDRQAFTGIAELARCYGMPAERIEDGDIFRIHGSAERAIRAMRSSNAGPWFLECLTYRWREHVGPGEDFGFGYRSAEEAAPWIENDQLKRLAGELDAHVRAEIERSVEEQIREAFAFAAASPFPEPSELLTDLTRS